MKTTSKIILLTSLFSFSCYAISDKELKENCLAEGTRQILSQAKANNCQGVKASDVVVDSVDNRWYNPHAYVWYKANVPKSCNPSGKIQVMVQDSFFERCDSNPIVDEKANAKNSHPNKERYAGDKGSTGGNDQDNSSNGGSQSVD